MFVLYSSSHKVSIYIYIKATPSRRLGSIVRIGFEFETFDLGMVRLELNLFKFGSVDQGQTRANTFDDMRIENDDGYVCSLGSRVTCLVTVTTVH